MCSSSGGGGGGSVTGRAFDQIQANPTAVFGEDLGQQGRPPSGQPGTDTSTTGNISTRPRTETGSGLGGTGGTSTGSTSGRTSTGSGLRM